MSGNMFRKARLSIQVLATCTILSACATPAVKLQCLPLKTYSAEQQKALADALAVLPDTSPVASAMIDYGQLRAADRACLDK